MSPTPFLGLSVMIHLGIIFLNRIRGRDNPIKRKPPKIPDASASRRLSLAVITSVMTVVTASAALLLDTAVMNQHSSIKYIQHIMTLDATHSPAHTSNNIYSTINYIL